MVLFKSCLERDSNVNIRFGIFIELRTQGYSVKFFDRKDNFCGMKWFWVVLAVVALYYYWMILHGCFKSGSMRAYATCVERRVLRL